MGDGAVTGKLHVVEDGNVTPCCGDEVDAEILVPANALVVLGTSLGIQVA